MSEEMIKVLTEAVMKEQADNRALRSEVARLRAAINAMTTRIDGRLHYITAEGIPQEIPAKIEKVARAFLDGGK